MNRKLSNSPSFTLIELLITTSIVALLAAAAIPSFQTFTRNQTLRRGVEQVRTDLRTAQNRAVTGIDRKKPGGGDYYWWGISFDFTGDANSYSFLQSTNSEDDPGAGESTRRVKKLPGNLKFNDSVSNVTHLWFKMITGEICSDTSCPISAAGVVAVCYGSTCPSVTVSPGGEIK